MAHASPARNAVAADDYRPGYEVVAERILAFIVDSGLQAGDRLPTEKELAELLGSTRSVTREAIKILSALGRVRARRGAGLFVAEGADTLVARLTARFQPTSLDDVRQLFGFRRTVECDAASLAALRAAPSQVRDLVAAADASLEASARGVETFGRYDTLFHEHLAAASQNFLLVISNRLVQQLQPQTNRLLFADQSSRPLVTAAHQHIAIAAAVASGDAAAAAAASAVHIDTTLGEFERRITARILGDDG